MVATPVFQKRGSQMGKFNITVALVACALLTTAAGCGEKKTIENGGTVAVTPLAQPGATCSSGAAYGGVYPEAYTNIGFQPYGQQARYPRGVQYHSQSGFCGCPSGYQPTCDMQYGMTCVPVMGLQNYEVAYWQLQNGGFVFNGFSGYAGYGNVYANQYPGAYGYGGGGYVPPQQPYASAQTCGSQVAQTCNVGTSQCGMGRCAPLSAGSAIGICVR